MRRQLHLLVLLLSLTSSSFARTSFDDMYHGIRYKEDYVSFTLPAWSLNWILRDDEQVKEAFAGLNRVRFIVSERHDQALHNALNAFLHNPDYTTLMEIKEGKSKIVFKVRDTPKCIREIVMIVRDGNDIVAINMKGRFKTEDLQPLIELARDNIVYY